MATKKKQEKDIHIANNNRNVNNNTVHVNVELPKKDEPKKKNTNWLLKSLVGGIIAIAVSLAIYYGKKNFDKTDKSNNIENLDPAVGVKQTDN